MKFNTIILALILGNASVAAADAWTGSGTVYSPERQPLATYEVAVENTDPVDGIVQSAVEVRHEDGQLTNITCEIRTAEYRWSKQCSDGQNGGGYYFDLGLASEYTELADGRAFSTQIIFDSDDAMRIIRTELRGNEVLRFYVESYTKSDAAE